MQNLKENRQKVKGEKVIENKFFVHKKSKIEFLEQKLAK